MLVACAGLSGRSKKVDTQTENIEKTEVDNMSEKNDVLVQVDHLKNISR